MLGPILAEGSQQHAGRDAHISKSAIAVNIATNALLGNVNVYENESKCVDHLILVQTCEIEVVHQSFKRRGMCCSGSPAYLQVKC